MVEVRMRWISREETTAELQGSEFFRKRRAFFNDNNEDFRLKQPGVRWQLVKEKRVEVYQDCISRIKEVFDEVCEKITGERRCVDLSLAQSCLLKLLCLYSLFQKEYQFSITCIANYQDSSYF